MWAVLQNDWSIFSHKNDMVKRNGTFLPFFLKLSSKNIWLNIFRYNLFNNVMEFFLNISLNLLNSVTKNICHYSKRAQTCHLCVTDQDATTAPTRHTWETWSLNWLQFMLQWIIIFPEFAEFSEFNESSASLKKKLQWFVYFSKGKNPENIHALNLMG